MDKYTTSQFRLNNAICRAYSGRFIRYQATLIPSRHAVAWIEVSSPLMEIISEEVHKKLSCGLGPQAYINGIHVAGFCATGLYEFIKDQIGACSSCTTTKMIMKGDSTLKKALKTLYGPDDLLGAAASTDPMSIVSCDEIGPFYIQDRNGAFTTTYILACVELLSYKVHLIPLPKLDTIHFVRALEILQSMRGKFTTLILDDHTVHRPLNKTEQSAEHIQKQQSILAGVSEEGNITLLANAGIQIVIASPDRHEKVGRAEFIVKKVKFFLASALKTWAFNDSFDFYHKVSLIALYLNERPIFHTPEGILTPYSLEQAMLKRASAKPKFFTIAEFLIPTNKKMYNQILKMASFSRQILFEVAAASAFTLLNKRTLNQKFQIGDLVYIPGRLLKKHPNSLRDALGKIKEVSCSGKDYTVEMIDGIKLKRHFSDLVSATATANQNDVKLIDPFQLIDFKTRILPEHLYPKFRLQLDKFKEQNPNIDITEVPDETSQHQAENNHTQELTGDQRVERAMGNGNQNSTDEIIRQMVSNVSKETINFPTNLREIQKPKSFNKKKCCKRDRISAPAYEQPIPIQQTEDLTNNTIDPVVENQQAIEELINFIPTNNSRTDSIDQDVDNQQVYNEPVQIQPEILETNRESVEKTSKNDRSMPIEGNPRRSARVSRLSAKALEMLSNQKDLQETSIFRK